MKNHRFFPAHLVTLIALALLSATATTKAQTVIDHLPYMISSSGLYVLNGNLNSAQTGGSLITVNASNVTIDFQNHYIAGPVGNTTQSTSGISANERSNVTIKNGTIAYCGNGILISGNNTATTNNVDQQIDNMRVTYCYSRGIEMDYAPGSRIPTARFPRRDTAAPPILPSEFTWLATVKSSRAMSSIP